MHAIRRGRLDPNAVAVQDITDLVALEMVSKDAASLERIPEEIRTAQVYKVAIRRGGENVLSMIDDKLLNPGVPYDKMSPIQQAIANAVEDRFDLSPAPEFSIGSIRLTRDEQGVPVLNVAVLESTGEQHSYSNHLHTLIGLSEPGAQMAESSGGSAVEEFVISQMSKIESSIDRAVTHSVSGVNFDFDAGQYTANLDVNGKRLSIPLDNETLKPDFRGNDFTGRKLLTLTKHIESEAKLQGVTAPMGIERVKDLASDLGEAVGRQLDVLHGDRGCDIYGFDKYGVPDKEMSFKSLTEAVQGLNERINSARIERDANIKHETPEDRRPEIRHRRDDSPSIRM